MQKNFYNTCSNYIHYLNTWFWKSPSAKFIHNKRCSKNLAKSLGIKVPEEIKQPKPYVFKPVGEHSAKNVFFVKDDNYIIEELILDINGNYANSMNFYVFTNEIKFIQTTEILEMLKDKSCFKERAYGYYLYPNWERFPLDKISVWNETNKPEIINEMATSAIKLANAFNKENAKYHYPPVKLIRIDFLYTINDYFFGELCVTPGLIIAKRITKEADAKLGKWL
jgi:hypothetical protein